MKTLEKTTFDKIEVGEVFARDGCWIICLKISPEYAILLARDYTPGMFSYLMEGEENYTYKKTFVYRLPKSVQELWIEV